MARRDRAAGKRARAEARREARRAARATRPSLPKRLLERVRGSFLTAVHLLQNPRDAPGMARAAFVRLWRSKGGGFYGLGYVFAFLILEMNTFAEQIETSTSLMGFVSDEAVGFLLRFTWTSLLNGALAFIWPILLLQELDNWGAAILVVTYLAYRSVLQPLLVRWLPELRPQATQGGQADNAVAPLADAAGAVATDAPTAPAAPAQPD